MHLLCAWFVRLEIASDAKTAVLHAHRRNSEGASEEAASTDSLPGCKFTGKRNTSTEPGDAATMEQGTFLGVNSKPPLN